MQREDLAQQHAAARRVQRESVGSTRSSPSSENAATEHGDAPLSTVARFNQDRTTLHAPTTNGTENSSLVTRKRFSVDRRMEEAARLLDASRPSWVCTKRGPGVTDHEYLAEQKLQLAVLCLRTMALGVGRGMLTLHTARPVVTQSITIPRLQLDGRVYPTGSPLTMDESQTTEQSRRWPLFHNGVAAGLRVVPRARDVAATAWVAYHEAGRLQDEPAGFLFGLGLTGHLIDLPSVKLRMYLSQGHESTSIGLLLGLAAARRGTRDDEISRVLSIHVPSLLPSTSAEVDVSVLIQTAAMVGMGLLFQGSANRRLVEVMLEEIGRPAPTSFTGDMNREGAALAAGLALGLVLLGKVCAEVERGGGGWDEQRV